MMMRRSVNAKERYYKIDLIPNLFGEVMVMRTYGSVNRLKPSGVMSQIFSNIHEAEESITTLIHQKQKKGYRIYPLIPAQK